ncbi:MAG: hypothetical protein ABEJ56_05660 [Candidatus Nanohaloarchaea archaeon]
MSDLTEFEVVGEFRFNIKAKNRADASRLVKNNIFVSSHHKAELDAVQILEVNTNKDAKR